jgi:hypothetical protein
MSNRPTSGHLFRLPYPSGSAPCHEVGSARSSHTVLRAALENVDALMHHFLATRGGVMSVERIGFVGFRSTDLAGLRRVFEEGLGMSPTRISEDQMRYRLGDGTRLELYSEADAFHGFFTTGAVVGFTVEDFDSSWDALLRIGIEAVTDIQQENGQKWVHFRLPDGTIAELIGRVRHPAS